MAVAKALAEYIINKDVDDNVSLFFSAVKIETPFVQLLIQGFLSTLHKMTRRLTFGGQPWVNPTKIKRFVSRSWEMAIQEKVKGFLSGCYLPVGKGL